MHRSHSQAGGRNIPLSAGGAERVGVRWGISSFRTAAPPTSPSRRYRAGSLPLPPQAGGEGHDPRERSVPAEMCACTSAFAGAGLHCYHTYMLSNLRLVLSVDVQPGDQHNVKHATGGLWSLLDRWDRGRWPTLLRGDLAWGIEPVMAQAEQRNLAYLFRLRTTKNVSRALQRAMAQSDWSDAGQGRQGKETAAGRLEPAAAGHSAAAPTERPLAIVDHGDPAQPRLAVDRSPAFSANNQSRVPAHTLGDANRNSLMASARSATAI